MSRDDSWLRRKPYLGKNHPQAGSDGYEKWPRLAAEIPPELAQEIDAARIRFDGMHSVTRAEAVRSGLRMWLNHHAPETPPPTYDVDGECVEIPDLAMLAAVVGDKDRYMNVSTMAYTWRGAALLGGQRGLEERLVVQVWEKTTWRARVMRTVDDAHEANANGEHRWGFCQACAEELLAAQTSIPGAPA